MKIKDSFASFHVENTDINFIEKYWGLNNKINPYNIGRSSSKMIWIKCDKKSEHPDYEIRASHFTNGVRCSYCAHRKFTKSESVGTLYPKSVELWSNKNVTTPYDHFPSTSEMIWWKCNNGIHEDFQRSLNKSSKAGYRCPTCSLERDESYLSQNARKYITEKYGYTLKRERECSIIPRHPDYPDDGRRDMPFDLEIVELKLVCEFHGKQHTQLDHFHELTAKTFGTTPEYEFEQQKWRDAYKKQYAIDNGYFYLALYYYEDDDNETYKKSIDDKIAEIIPECVIKKTILNNKKKFRPKLKNTNKQFLSVVNDWNNGDSVITIIKNHSISGATARNYLKRGTKLGLCAYYADGVALKKKVICITTGEVFNSIHDASLKYSSAGSICTCLKGRQEFAGKLPDGTKLKWEYYSENSSQSTLNSHPA